MSKPLHRVFFCDSFYFIGLALQKLVHSPSFNPTNSPPSSSTPMVISAKESENRTTKNLAPPTFHSMT